MNDPARTPIKCGAKTRSGAPCAKFPVEGKRRCRLHGGLSTGPQTPAGSAALSAADNPLAAALAVFESPCLTTGAAASAPASTRPDGDGGVTVIISLYRFVAIFCDLRDACVSRRLTLETKTTPTPPPELPLDDESSPMRS